MIHSHAPGHPFVPSWSSIRAESSALFLCGEAPAQNIKVSKPAVSLLLTGGTGVSADDLTV